MPREPRICPVCTEPCRQGQVTITLGGVRHHLACAQRAGLAARERGAPTKGPTAAGVTIQMRVRPEWLESADAAASAAGLSRTAYVVRAVDQAIKATG
jgi:hypothetical protein